MNDLREAVPALEAAVTLALATGDQSGLDVLGYGEISLVVGLETRTGRYACKRLPLFADRAAYRRYEVVFHDHLAALASAGVEPVDSDLHPLDVDDGVVGYCVQPALDPASLGPAVLREPEGEHFLRDVIETTARAIGPTLGLDAQISNWAQVDGQLRYLDVTTPLLRDDRGDERLDLDLFLASLPRALRSVVRRFLLDGILSHYYDTRAAVLDLSANLVKERLDHQLPAALDAAAAVVDDPITEREARRYYASDARMWEVLQRLRRLDRSWQRHVRRRPYPFLLPEPIDR